MLLNSLTLPLSMFDQHVMCLHGDQGEENQSKICINEAAASFWLSVHGVAWRSLACKTRRERGRRAAFACLSNNNACKPCLGADQI